MKNKIITNIVILIWVSISFGLSANDKSSKELVAQKKADFIIKMATNIYYDSPSKTKDYTIGVFGNSREIRQLVKELLIRTEKSNIKNKTIKVLQFKRNRNIKPVDLLFITGDSKIRFSSLNEKLKGKPYILLTEDFPFGASVLNFSINRDNDLFFELQEDYFDNNNLIISSQIKESKQRIFTEKEWSEKLHIALAIIDKKQETIEKKDLTIENKSKEIEDKSEVIRHLSLIISIICISLMIIIVMSFMLYRGNKQRKKILKEITDSINYAKGIQNSILFKDTMYDNYVDSYFVFYKPKNIVSGDFYWIHHKENKVFFIVADCTGHGVPGAMLTLICHNALMRAIKEFKICKPSEILDKTAELLKNRLSEEEFGNEGMDLAVCCLDLDSNKLEFAGAKNPLYYVQNNQLQIIKGDRLSIGMLENGQKYTNHVLTYKKGDVFYMFSDGYADQFGSETDKKFLSSNFKKMLMENHKSTMKEQENIISIVFEEWKGKREQTDDVCVMGVKI